MKNRELLKKAFIAGQRFGSFKTDKNFNDFLDENKEAINYTRCSTLLKMDKKAEINRLNNSLKNIEDDEDFRLDDFSEWVRQKSFIEGKINAISNF